MLANQPSNLKKIKKKLKIYKKSEIYVHAYKKLKLYKWINKNYKNLFYN